MAICIITLIIFYSGIIAVVNAERSLSDINWETRNKYANKRKLLEKEVSFLTSLMVKGITIKILTGKIVAFAS